MPFFFIFFGWCSLTLHVTEGILLYYTPWRTHNIYYFSPPRSKSKRPFNRPNVRDHDYYEEEYEDDYPEYDDDYEEEEEERRDTRRPEVRPKQFSSRPQQQQVGLMFMYTFK